MTIDLKGEVFIQRESGPVFKSLARREDGAWFQRYTRFHNSYEVTVGYWFEIGSFQEMYYEKRYQDGSGRDRLKPIGYSSMPGLHDVGLPQEPIARA